MTAASSDRSAPGQSPAGVPYFRLAEPKAGVYDPSGASIVNIDDYPRYEIAEGVVFCPVFGRNLSLNFVVFPAAQRLPHPHPPRGADQHRARRGDGDHRG